MLIDGTRAAGVSWGDTGCPCALDQELLGEMARADRRQGIDVDLRTVTASGAADLLPGVGARRRRRGWGAAVTSRHPKRIR
ncbi:MULTISPECIES: hypothetical protein [unclassified Streptomyces]|uniref:hypothetical protein n=1 Tax=unclassified Streptomyces TaxID=2593676 RepID=UPI002E12B767|nr:MULTISPECIES: hypothetical protein [unclassified Streptomyces]WSJ25977.1 hypothetical protein OG384_30385 [Streptomyces sp. NBC_01324]